MRKALVVSFAAHGALIGAVRPLAAHQPVLAPAEDHWTGTTAELPFGAQTGPLYDIAVDTPSAPAAPPAPAPVPVPVPDAPAQKPAPAPVIAAPTATAPPAPKPHPRPLPASGEGRDHGERAPADQERASVNSPPRKRGGGGGGVSAGGVFGAEGEASVRSLGRALTRAIPGACASDPLWTTLPKGDAGKMEIEVRVDESGHITSAEPRRTDAPKALVSLLRRTLVMLQAGTFAVRSGTVSAGTESIELRASIHDMPTGDEESPFMGKDGLRNDTQRGKAWFEVPGGHYVEVSVKVLRVDAK